ncbi:MAG: bifunctional 3-(3-hydroxy-phenyl)propionate/3-hydroxycinnamic acid hydroxylase [Pseudomonadota bacterium]
MSEADVIIVGAGPTGSVLSILLGLAGHQVLVLERDPEVYPLPRAVHMDHEIVRVMQQVGILPDFLPHTSPVSDYIFQNAAGEVLLQVAGGNRLANSGHPASVMFVQPELETLLRQRMGQITGIKAVFGANVTRIIEGSTPGVEYEHPGGTETVRASYLIGCDGASSLVRQTLAPKIVDLGFDEPWVVIDTQIKTRLDLPHDTAYQFCEPARPTTCVPAGPGRRRWEFMLLPNETPEQMREPEAIWPLLARWGNPDSLELIRIAVYRFHALMVEQWRFGNILLAGDAAHQTPPFMGQGLCSGIRDAVNLAWKLDRVLNDKSTDALLDTYAAERAPHFRHVVETSIGMGRLVCEQDPAAAAVRDRTMLEARKAGKQGLGASQQGQVAPLTAGAIDNSTAGAGLLFPQPEVSVDGVTARMDDILGCGVRLFVQDPGLMPDQDQLRQLGITGVVLGAGQTVETGPPGAASWLKHHGCTAALVRPDHYVFGTATDAGGINRLIRRFAGAIASGT